MPKQKLDPTSFPRVSVVVNRRHDLNRYSWDLLLPSFLTDLAGIDWNDEHNFADNRSFRISYSTFRNIYFKVRTPLIVTQVIRMFFISTERWVLKLTNFFFFFKEPIKLQNNLTGSRVNAGVEVYGKPSLPLGTRLTVDPHCTDEFGRKA